MLVVGRIVLLAMIGVCAVVACSAGLGWLLVKFFPFTHYEATLLIMAATVIVAFCILTLVSMGLVVSLQDGKGVILDADNESVPARVVF